MGLGKTGPAHFFPPPKCSDLSIYFQSFDLSYSFTVSDKLRLIYYKERIKLSKNQTVYFVLLHNGMGKDWASPFFPPLKNVQTFLFIFQTFSLCYSFTVPEELRMNYSNERVNFSNLQTYWYFYIMGWGKTGPASTFPPPKRSDLSIYFSNFRLKLLFHCI